MVCSTSTYLGFICRTICACRIGAAFIIHAVPISYFVALAVGPYCNMTKCVINNKVTANVAMANISVSQHRKHYRLYSDDVLFDSLLKFFLQDEQEPLHVFVEKENMKRSTFRRFFIESGLQKLKESGCKDEVQARQCLMTYFEKKVKNRSFRTENATKKQGICQITKNLLLFSYAVCWEAWVMA